MFRYKYKLDANWFDGEETPIRGLEDLTEQIERDYELRGLLLKFPERIEFMGDAYDYIYQVRQLDTFCGQIEFELFIDDGSGNYTMYQKAIIYVSTAVVNLSSCTVDCELIDNSFFAKIKNNYKVEAFLGGEKSKNGTTIIPCPQKTFTFFDPSDGSIVPSNRYGYDLYDALKYLVQYMTDGEIVFQSDWFENYTSDNFKAGVQETPDALFNGKGIRDITELSNFEVRTTFERVWGDVSRACNLWFTFIEVGGQLVMKAEREEYFYDSRSDYSFSNSVDVQLSTINELLYATIEVGSEVNYYSKSGGEYMGFIPALTFKPEIYNVQGQCNTDSSLNLKTRSVTDSNAIAFQLLDATATDNFDNHTFIVGYHYIPSGGVYATQGYDLFQSTERYYNFRYLNKRVLEANTFHGDLVKWNNPGDVTFNAFVASSSYTDQVSTFTKIPFNAETYDNGNDFDITAYEWTCPADGFYSFNIRIVINTNSMWWCSDVGCLNKLPFTTFIQSWILTLDPNIAEGSATIFPLIDSNSVYTFEFAISAFYKLGDTEYIDFKFQPVGGIMPTFFDIDYNLNNSVWRMDYSNNGGIFKPSDRDKIFINKFALNNVIEQNDWLSIRNNMINRKTIQLDNQTVSVWIKSLKRKVLTGEIEAELITSNENL
jgi:hypothetical protein